ncbi:MAG: GNAT family N-acetyltransferase [Rhodoferax sp.]|nr:GNAT family N-acetyltransferase [Rhodoferax sp.]
MKDGVCIAWKDCLLDALHPRELYAILQLRSAVFVVEQACLFHDMDGLDHQAVHVTAFADGRLVAYARCFGPGVVFPEASIGRITTHAAVRGSKLGHALVRRAKSVVGQRWGAQVIRIGAQARLKGFYEGHGFVDQNRCYLEDGIDHLEMVWQP